MLSEISDVKQHKKEDFRRWFTSKYFDLIVWYGKDVQISGFQLCYDKVNNERALTWRVNEGFSHHKVDDGETSGRIKMSPVLMEDVVFDKETVLERFRAESQEIDAEISDFICEKIDNYSSKVTGIWKNLMN